MQEATSGVADAQEGAQGRGSGERAYRKATQQRGLAAGSGKGQRSLEGRKVSKEPQGPLSPGPEMQPRKEGEELPLRWCLVSHTLACLLS